MAKPVIWKKGAKGQLTVEQKQLIAAFEDMLIKAAADAGRRLGALTVESAGRFGVKLEERFMSSSSKSHRFYRASVGSSIERMVYAHLPKWVTSMDPQPSSEGWSGLYRQDRHLDRYRPGDLCHRIHEIRRRPALHL